MADRGLWKKEVYANRFKVMSGLAVLTALVLLIVLTYDYTIGILESAPVPEFVRGMLEGQLELLKDYRYYIWSQWFGKNLIQLGSILAVFFGAGLITSEVSGKTILFLLARPISRQAVFTVKYVVGLTALASVIVVTTVFLYIAVTATGHYYPPVSLAGHTLMAVAGLGLIYSMAVYFSTIFDTTMKSFLISLPALFLLSLPMYFEPVRRFSVYYQMQGVGILKGEGFPVISFIILVLLSFVLYWLGKNQFTKRDL